MSDEAQFQEENHETPAAAQPPRTPKSPRPPKPPIESLPNDDPFAATNFGADGEDVPTGIDDVPFDLGVPGDDQFVFVSSDPRHALIARSFLSGCGFFFTLPLRVVMDFG